MRAVALAIKWRVVQGNMDPGCCGRAAGTDRRRVATILLLVSVREKGTSLTWTWHSSDVPLVNMLAHCEAVHRLRAVSQLGELYGSRVATRSTDRTCFIGLPRRSSDKDPPAFIGGADVGFEQGGEVTRAAMVVAEISGRLNW